MMTHSCSLTFYLMGFSSRDTTLNTLLNTVLLITRLEGLGDPQATEIWENNKDWQDTSAAVALRVRVLFQKPLKHTILLRTLVVLSCGICSSRGDEKPTYDEAVLKKQKSHYSPVVINNCKPDSSTLQHPLWSTSTISPLHISKPSQRELSV